MEDNHIKVYTLLHPLTIYHMPLFEKSIQLIKKQRSGVFTLSYLLLDKISGAT